ncbi:MAG: hypothetical protein GC160_00660 [Acidobacteria bacterium]|nr:hypothetical protein [Acidobacteriota bacterium]
MDRRGFLSASAALAAGAASAADAGGNQFIEVREYKMRNSKAQQSNRLRDFFEQAHLPMTKRVGVAAVGYFSVYLGEESPRFFLVQAYNSLAHMQEVLDAKAADKAWMKASDELGSDPNPPFDRAGSRLLRTFDGMKRLDAPALSEDKAPRFFDLRTYQAETFHDVREKINMFNTEEISIFRKVGINPVFFGETIIGDKMPNLTYLVWYDDEAARAKAWNAFLSHPDWIRIRSKPGWGNDDIVADVGNTHLKPLPFSPIR